MVLWQSLHEEKHDNERAAALDIIHDCVVERDDRRDVETTATMLINSSRLCAHHTSSDSGLNPTWWQTPEQIHPDDKISRADQDRMTNKPALSNPQNEVPPLKGKEPLCTRDSRRAWNQLASCFG
jgi:hypothetical protein